jgi:ABC-type cobalamin transport system ATPase subunit
MKRLVVVILLLATGIISVASDVTIGELQVGLDASESNATLSPRVMKFADWNVDSTTASLASSQGRIRSLEGVLEVFNPQRLARRWNYTQNNLTNGCETHVNHYLTHLHNGELWALKSEYLKTII